MNIGQTHIDFEALLIEGPAGRFSVESKVMDVFAILAENPNAVISRETLIEKVWGVEHGGDERLSRAISILRKALGDIRGQHSHIETIPRKGYRFIAEQGHEPGGQGVPPDTMNDEADAAKNALPAKRPLTPVVPLVEPSASHKKRNRFGKMGALAAIILIGVAMIGIRTGYFDKASQKASQISRLEAGLEHVKHYMQDNAIVQAQTLFSGVLADNPDHAAAQAGLALALLREYAYLETDPAILHRAKATAELSLSLAPQLALANIAVGWAAGYEGEFDKALKAYDRADILDPDNLFTLVGRVTTYQKQNLHQQARETLTRAISLYPDYAFFHSLLGHQLMKEGEFVQGEASFRQAIALENNVPRFYSQLAESLHRQSRTPEAIKVIQDGLKIREDGALYNNLGTYLSDQGHYELAVQAIESAIQKGNSYGYLFWGNLGSLYSYIPSRKVEANAAFDRAIQLLQAKMELVNGKDPILQHRAAFYLAKRGKFDLAREAMARAQFDGPMPAFELYRAGCIHEIMGERDQALTQLEAAVKAGFPLHYIAEEPELKTLRQDPKYHRLYARLSPDL
ncbi:MAG: winged helix-turn-helix domain-containing protein [Robiginitomaculum sp.]|nr:winged helix-turn-helix domain-containing protein [Robiginitomaculum sp.]MDQ7078396.1 winged helix-turn-helix domain-containing protein [Robiginitomaculum sp.]